jgi:hypothetical protein
MMFHGGHEKRYNRHRATRSMTTIRLNANPLPISTQPRRFTNNARHVFKFNEETIPACPPCDVLWIDGLPSTRLAFTLKTFDQSSEAVVLHGALRNANSFGHRILSEILKEKWEVIRDVELGNLDSHLLVLHKIKSPLIYYNYHQTEA